MRARWLGASGALIAACTGSGAVANHAIEPPQPGAPDATRPPAPPAIPVASALSVIGCTDDAEHVCMPAGIAQLGRASNEARFEERPPRGARLHAFRVDRREVTVDAYARCVTSGRCRAPVCDDGHVPATSGPVDCVAWQDARTYCESEGARLPSEAEWERVAAGLLPVHRVYPWGDDAGVLADGAAGAEDTTPDGVRDLGGSLAEWVDDAGAFYLLPARRDAGTSDGAVDASSPEAGASDTVEGELAGATPVDQPDAAMPVMDDPRGPDAGTWRIVRGGNAGFAAAEWTTTRRRFRLPGDRRAWIGFRCVRDPAHPPLD